ncbi:hypothetical protein M3642_12650 [Priestia megaterium]|nr:hypothetical protein [Priestia megaterium]
MEGKTKTPAGKGESGTGETPQKAKSCKEINSGVTSSSAHLSNLFVFRQNGLRCLNIFTILNAFLHGG